MSDSKLYTVLCDLLRAEGWNFQRVANREVVDLTFGVGTGTIDVHVQAFEPIGALSITAGAGHTLLPQHRGKLAELLMRMNLQMTIGNFEMDWDDLRVFFRATNVFDGVPPTSRVVAGMVHAAVAETDRMMVLLRELAACAPEAVAGYDIGRLLRRDDLIPNAEN